MSMTLAEAMAMAVIRGERVAAYALADKLIEERNNPENIQQQAAALHQETHRRPVDGYEVYSWPEFLAFCKRAGILWDLHTREITFTLREGELLVIKQEYVARDGGPTEGQQ